MQVLIKSIIYWLTWGARVDGERHDHTLSSRQDTSTDDW